jgi:UPF0271 protein
MSVDLNCDLGESFGRYDLGQDAAIMPLITSVNVACGFHAGDPAVMRRTVQLARQNKVALGAHPGYPDLQGFGRRQVNFSSQEVTDIVIYQLGALAAFAAAEGTKLVHVKPHGALYNLASKDITTAKAIAQAVHDVDPKLILVGLAGSALVTAGKAMGLEVTNEGFPDRTYLPDGQLMPRTEENAVIDQPEIIASNALRLVKEGLTVDGQKVRIDTLCLHGDNPKALENARAVRQLLERAGIKISPLKNT